TIFVSVTWESIHRSWLTPQAVHFCPVTGYFGTMIHTAKVLSIPGPDKPWHTGSMVGFDLETTGKNPHEARIVTASIVLLDPQGRTRAHAEWLLDPGVEIPAEAAAVHG